jgi:REP-associated tyrosine transposase
VQRRKGRRGLSTIGSKIGKPRRVPYIKKVSKRGRMLYITAMAKQIITRRNLPHWYVPGAEHFVTFRLAGTIPRHILDELKQRGAQWLKQRPPAGITGLEWRHRVHKRLFAAYDDYLDLNRDIAWLADARLAALVRSSLWHLHGKMYDLHAYCIMPNHVHVLFRPYDADVGQASPLARSDRSTIGLTPGTSGDVERRTSGDVERRTSEDVERRTSEDACATEWQVGERADRGSPLSSIMHSLKGFTAHRANKILRRKGQFWQHESYNHWVRDGDELERIVAYINGNPVKAKLAKCIQDWFWGSAHDRYLTDGDTSGWLPAADA